MNTINPFTGKIYFIKGAYLYDICENHFDTYYKYLPLSSIVNTMYNDFLNAYTDPGSYGSENRLQESINEYRDIIRAKQQKLLDMVANPRIVVSNIDTLQEEYQKSEEVNVHFTERGIDMANLSATVDYREGI